MACAIALTSETYSALEGDGVATVCVLLLGQPTIDVSVLLSTVPGSATGLLLTYTVWCTVFSTLLLHAEGADYIPLSESITFVSGSGVSTMCRDVTLIDDNTEEPEESFQVQISESDCFLSRTVANVTIIDDGM